MNTLRTWGRRIVLALQFMTRIPIRANLTIGEGDMAWSAAFFPLAGLIVGGVSVLAFVGLYLLTLSPLLAIGAALLAGTMFTGGIHLDGLGDTCDGVFSGRSRERALEIMKDTRMGAFGVLAIVFGLLLKGTALADLYAWDAARIAGVLALMPVMGRLSIVLAAAAGKPARPDGSGRLFLEEVGVPQFIVALLLSLAAGWAILGLGAWIGLATVLLASAGVTVFLSRRLGGLTGDCLGAVSEVGEVIFAAAMLSVCRFGL